MAQGADASFAAAARTDYVLTAPVRYAGAVDGQTIVVNRLREFARLRPDGSGTPLRLPMRRSRFTLSSSIVAARGSDGFAVTEHGWWYATLDEQDGTAAMTFMKHDGSRATHVRPFPSTTNIHWWLIALPGDEPRALEITLTGSTLLDEATIIRELDWNGERRTWRLPQVRFAAEAPRSLTAELLPDGRIALFSNDAGLSMYLLSDEGNVETVVLRNVRIRQFDTAIDGAGRLAIATARRDEAAIDAAVFDFGNPGQAEWHSFGHEATVMGRLRELQVVATGTGFVAAWINEREGQRIEATELSADGRRGAIVEVGQASPRGDGTFFDVQALREELLFWWDDGERLVERRLPLSLTGYALLRELTQRYCSAEARSH